jgi:hypothetical protein
MSDDKRRGQEIWAWVVDDPSGQHGIIAFTDSSTGLLLQAVNSKREPLERIRHIAVEAARLTGLPVQLRHFTHMEVVDEVKP